MIFTLLSLEPIEFKSKIVQKRCYNIKIPAIIEYPHPSKVHPY